MSKTTKRAKCKACASMKFRWPRAWLVIDKRRRSFRVQLYGRKPKQSAHRKVFAMCVYVGPRVRHPAAAAKGRKR